MNERALGLKRILGVWDGLAVGLVIGVGILRTPGLIAGYLGTPSLILLVRTAGGLPDYGVSFGPVDFASAAEAFGAWAARVSGIIRS